MTKSYSAYWEEGSELLYYELHEVREKNKWTYVYHIFYLTPCLSKSWAGPYWSVQLRFPL